MCTSLYKKTAACNLLSDTTGPPRIIMRLVGSPKPAGLEIQLLAFKPYARAAGESEPRASGERDARAQTWGGTRCLKNVKVRPSAKHATGPTQRHTNRAPRVSPPSASGQFTTRRALGAGWYEKLLAALSRRGWSNTAHLGCDGEACQAQRARQTRRRWDRVGR